LSIPCTVNLTCQKRFTSRFPFFERNTAPLGEVAVKPVKQAIVSARGLNPTRRCDGGTRYERVQIKRFALFRHIPSIPAS
jgi:hypothetical protein